MTRRGRPPLVVTVDGPAASGKSTAAVRLAAALGIPFLSTGALYRAVALEALRRRLPWSHARALARVAMRLTLRFARGSRGSVRVLLRGDDVTAALASPEVARASSDHVASCRPVREAVVAWSRRFAARQGAVAEGRDCGTVIFPGARHKFFLTASAAERARRRVADLAAIGHRASLEAVRRAVVRRDRADAARPWGALVPATDAWVVETTARVPAETVALMRRLMGR